MYVFYSFEHVHTSFAGNTDTLPSINTSYKRYFDVNRLVVAELLLYIVCPCMMWWAVSRAAVTVRRGKRDHTRKFYLTTNPTLKMRRSNLQKWRCFRLPFTSSDYFVCLCWPCLLILFYNSSCDVWQRVQIATVFSIQCSQFSCYFPSLCYATWFCCPITVCYEIQMITLFIIECHRSAVTCLLVGPNILLRILSSDTLSLCCPLRRHNFTPVRKKSKLLFSFVLMLVFR